MGNGSSASLNSRLHSLLAKDTDPSKEGQAFPNPEGVLCFHSYSSKLEMAKTGLQSLDHSNMQPAAWHRGF